MNEPWKKTLKPFAREIEQLEISFDKRIGKLSDRKLVELLSACGLPSMSNCSWSTWEAAQKVSVMCRQENDRRKSQGPRQEGGA